MADSTDKPTKPTMGDLPKLSKDEWAVWTGGKPKADWSGLDTIASVEFTTPNQLRPVYANSAQKSYNHRKLRLDDKFDKSNDLLVFQDTIWEHFIDTGMDTIAYVPDPVSSDKMVNVIANHARFRIKSADTMTVPQLALYDKYDKAKTAVLVYSFLIL